MTQRPSLGKIRKLLSDSVVYGLGNYATRVIGFFLIPVYTRYLLPTDYGILSLANMIGNLLFIVCNMGQSTAFFRSYYDHDDDAGRTTVVTTSIILGLACCAPLGVALLAWPGPLAVVAFGSPLYTGILVLVSLSTISNVLLRIPFAILRAEEKATRYAVLSVSRGLLGIVVALVLVVGFGQGVAGVVWSQFLSHFVFLAVLLPGMLRGLRWTFSTKTARHLLEYGWPLVFAGLATFILNLSDRYFLKHYSTLHELGLYSLGYSLAEGLFLLVTAMRLAYPPFVFSNMKAPDAPRLYGRVLTYYVAGMGFLVLALSVLAADVVRIMAAADYYDAHRVVPLVALGELFHGFSFLSPIGLMITRKSMFRMWSVVIAAGLNLLLNYLWIPTHGMMGAAAATAVSFLVQAILVTTFALRFYPVDFERTRMLKAALVCGAVYLLSTGVPADAPWMLALAVRLGILALYPVGLGLLGFFEAEELESAAGLVRAMKGRLGLAAQRS
jgi:O-antigen/teichoic acid export membrane protein